jgi:uncharacterized cupin superfamily protein
MKSRILNLRKVRIERVVHGKSFHLEIARVGTELGSRKLGFNVTVIPPGKKSWPFHFHHANEEMFFILEGRGTIRIGGARHKIARGDFISLPAGRSFAHQILNTSRAPLRYLAVSTMEATDVAEYLDSGKLGIFAGAPPGRAAAKGATRHFTRVADGVPYWEGEK